MSAENPRPPLPDFDKEFRDDLNERWTGRRIVLLASITAGLAALMLGVLSLILKLAAHGYRLF